MAHCRGPARARLPADQDPWLAWPPPVIGLLHRRSLSTVQPARTRIAYSTHDCKIEIVGERKGACMTDGHFDAAAFYAALDGVREARKINWKQVAAASKVSASTLTRL